MTESYNRPTISTANSRGNPCQTNSTASVADRAVLIASILKSDCGTIAVGTRDRERVENVDGDGPFAGVRLNAGDGRTVDDG